MGVLMRHAKQRIETEAALRSQIRSLAGSAQQLYAANQMLMRRLIELEGELDAACQMMSDEMICHLMSGGLYDQDEDDS